jgi:hypothetical protein
MALPRSDLIPSSSLVDSIIHFRDLTLFHPLFSSDAQSLNGRLIQGQEQTSPFPTAFEGANLRQFSGGLVQDVFHAVPHDGMALWEQWIPHFGE